MAAEREGARERILDAANTLFYAKGIRNTGIDEVIASAGVAKASMYKHFPSKDALIEAYVRRRDREWRDWFAARLATAGPDAMTRLAAVFDVLEEWFRGEVFRGCAFINASVELANPHHPGHAAALEHKQAMRAHLAELAREAGLRQPEQVADQLALLVDGAIVAAVLEGDPSAAQRAGAAASALLNAAR